MLLYVLVPSFLVYLTLHVSGGVVLSLRKRLDDILYDTCLLRGIIIEAYVYTYSSCFVEDSLLFSPVASTAYF